MDEYERHILGRKGENRATEYLKSINYEIIERNFKCKQGEIDIIAYDNEKNEYVFIEVKTRTNFEYGKPVDAVDKKKKKHILLATKYYVYLNKLENEYIRFDIIQIYKNKKFYLNHLKNVEIYERIIIKNR